MRRNPFYALLAPDEGFWPLERLDDPASVRIGIAPMPTKCPPTPVNATWLDRQDKVN